MILKASFLFCLISLSLCFPQYDDYGCSPPDCGGYAAAGKIHYQNMQTFVTKYVLQLLNLKDNQQSQDQGM